MRANKYDEQILKVTNPNESIQELVRKPKRNFLFQVIDLFLDFIPSSLDQIKAEGAFYLVVNDHEAKLVHIDRTLHLQAQDVTNIIRNRKKKNSFDFDGYQYRIVRKIQ